MGRFGYSRVAFSPLRDSTLSHAPRILHAGTLRAPHGQRPATRRDDQREFSILDAIQDSNSLAPRAVDVISTRASDMSTMQISNRMQIRAKTIHRPEFRTSAASDRGFGTGDPQASRDVLTTSIQRAARGFEWCGSNR